MTRKLVSIFLLVLIVSGFAFGTVGAQGRIIIRHGIRFNHSFQAQTSEDAWDCTLPLRVNVRQGPSAGTELFGLVHINIDDMGGAEGVYEVVAPEAQMGEIPMVGQITGRSVSLMFSVTDDTSIYGVGTSHEALTSNCNTAWGGPVVGPGEGDLGDWACTPNFCCGGGVCMICQLVGSTNVCTKDPVRTSQN
jgi:hypothetical protein